MSANRVYLRRGGPGGKPGSGGTGTVLIDGRKFATGRIDRIIPSLFGVETADVDRDLYTPVTLDYKKGKVTIDLK